MAILYPEMKTTVNENRAMVKLMRSVVSVHGAEFHGYWTLRRML